MNVFGRTMNAFGRTVSGVGSRGQAVLLPRTAGGAVPQRHREFPGSNEIGEMATGRRGGDTDCGRDVVGEQRPVGGGEELQDALLGRRPRVVPIGRPGTEAQRRERPVDGPLVDVFGIEDAPVLGVAGEPAGEFGVVERFDQVGERIAVRTAAASVSAPTTKQSQGRSPTRSMPEPSGR